VNAAMKKTKCATCGHVGASHGPAWCYACERLVHLGGADANHVFVPVSGGEAAP
jgi:hypothetical protein